MLPWLKRTVDGKFRHRWHWLPNRRRWWKRTACTGFLYYPSAWLCAVGWLNPAAFKIFHCRLRQCKRSFVRLRFAESSLFHQSTRPHALSSRTLKEPGNPFLPPREPGTNHRSHVTAAVMKMYIVWEGKMGADGVRELVKDDAMRVETGDGRQRKCDPEYRNNGSHTMSQGAKKSIWNVMRKKCYFVQMKMCMRHRL